jgi:hypothetical protein
MYEDRRSSFTSSSFINIAYHIHQQIQSSNMEYDHSTISDGSEAQSFPHESTRSGGRDGKLRVYGSETDVSVLNEPINFPFSGRVAKNRFLKG